MSARLGHVRWIGGGSGAGKSTIARQLAADYDLRLYGCDATRPERVRRSNVSDDPLLHGFLGMNADERWVNRPPSVMFETFHGFQGEGFDLIVEDLLALPEGPLVLAEGFELLPRLVAPLLIRPNQAVWLVPTPEVRRATFDTRGSTWDIARMTSDPEKALANLLARDALFTEVVAREAAALGLKVIEVDGDLRVGKLMNKVAESLGLGTS